jgi:hypothetical protein
MWILAGIVMLGAAAPARADLEIWLSASTGSNNNPPHASDKVASAASGTSVSFNLANFLGFNISILESSSNSPGTPTSSLLAGSAAQITNNNTTTATLYFTLGDTGFTMPTSGTLQSDIFGTVGMGDPSNSLTFWSYVNNDNSQNGTGGSTPAGAQTPSITNVGSFNDLKFGSVSNLSTPYSMTLRFALTLGPNASIQFASSSTLIPTSTPEPSSLVLAAIGALGLAGYGVRRRGKA